MDEDFGRITIVSNRLPVVLEDGEVVRSSGGLIAAVDGALEDGSWRWIGWPGAECPEDEQPRVRERLRDEFGCIPVFLSESEIDEYYVGFSNSSIWPLFHYFLTDVNHESSWFQCYKKVNERFADTVAEEAGEGELIWIHDYHLLLLPALLRERRPDLRIGFFLHTPFPSYEVFRCHPNRKELLQGLMGADLIGFHTFGYLRHFRSSVLRILGIESEINTISHSSHTTAIDVFPIGIHWPRFREALASEEFKQKLEGFHRVYGGRKVVLSVERLDYTKGVPRKLQAIELFLEQNPELRDECSFVLVAVPSRERVERYQQLQEEVQYAVGRINGEYSSLSNIPVHFVHRSVSFPELCAMYALADVALVTPLMDGMNLVAKEYIACQEKDIGVLILSEFSGAAQELFDSVMVNPYNVEEVARAIKDALFLDPDSRTVRTHHMRRRIIEHDSRLWASEFLSDLAKSPFEAQLTTTCEPVGQAFIEKFRDTSKKKELVLDYDGTLAEIVLNPDEAVPRPELHETFKALADRPDFTVSVVSGRDQDFLALHLGQYPITLVAEHGYKVRRPGGDWELFSADIDLSWKEDIIAIAEHFSQTTPGSKVEVKSSSIVWHFRGTDPEFGVWKAGELLGELREACANLPVEIRRGKSIVEVRSQHVSKGLVMRHMLHESEYDLALCAGDDQTDESMFTQKIDNLYSIKVGRGETAAKYHVKNPKAFRRFLAALVG